MSRRTLAAGAFALALAPAAAAQCTSTGPDLIVGDLPGITNYAATGGFDAIALGERLCNDGSVALAWQSGTAQHPVTVTNLYRLTLVDGCERFEQIGMSWARHEVLPLQQGGCCTGCVPGAFDELGVRCSTDSSASAMGLQGGLGPRSEVDPESGAFVFPAGSPPIADATSRRLRYAVADVAPSGPNVRYLAEMLAVTPDEAGGPNRDDNATWRAVTTTGGADPVFLLSGAATPGQAAIEAWAACAGMAGFAVDTSFGGRVVAASRATPLPDGWWHYEYVVFNQGCTAGVRAFTVPVQPGVALRAIGFHDVAYHSGDGPGGVDLDGADWTAAFSGGALTWATTPWSVNPDANALRFGTAYTFRFDASAAPVQTAHTLERFVPGAPATAPVVLAGPGAGVGSAFCLGDGSASACPCGNASVPGAGEGCLHSFGTGGRLAASGTAALLADTLVLQGSRMPSSTALYFQGTAQQAGGAGVAFGDGLRCAGGTVVRLGTKVNAGGASSYPVAGDVGIALKGGVAAPGTRTYQVWYRNAAAFCTSATFNLTNGLEVTWQ